MNTLAPYRNFNRASTIRGAMALGKYAYANRRMITKMAARLRFRRKTGRKFPARPISKARKFIGSAITRKTIPIHTLTVSELLALDSRVLYITDTSTVTQGTAENQRSRDIIDLSGIRLNCNIYSLNNQGMMYYNIALVLNKDGRDVTTTGFFRGYVDRQQDFTIGLAAVDYHSLPINTDKFAVLMHKRIKIAPLASTTGTGDVNTVDNMVCFQKYLPIKRRLTYGSTDITPELADQKIFIVQWCVQFSDGVASPSILSVARNQQRVQYYFKNSAP